MPTIPYTLPEAIACEEGFYVEGSRPQRNNNPGDLEWHPWMTRFYSGGGDPRFAIFPNPDEGFAALKHLLGFPIYQGKTIAEAIAQFAPGSENDVASYVRNVCSWTEQQPGAVIDGLLA